MIWWQKFWSICFLYLFQSFKLHTWLSIPHNDTTFYLTMDVDFHSFHFIAFFFSSHRFDLRRVFINFKNEKCACKWKQIEWTQMAGLKPTTEWRRTNEWIRRKKNYYGNAFVLQFIKCMNIGSFTYIHTLLLTHLKIVDSLYFVRFSFTHSVSFDNKMKRINLNLCKM